MVLPVSTRVSILEDASTIALVVHGVGDHFLTDLLQPAKRGFRLLGIEGRTEEVRIDDFPQMDGTTGYQDVLKIETPEHRHVIVPVAWSRLRMRSAQHVMHLNAGISETISQSFAPLILIFVDAVRCLPKAGSIGWKMAIASADLILLTLIAGLIGGIIYVESNLPYWFPTGPSSPWNLPLVILPILLMLWLIARRLLPLFDFIGDVAAYIGRSSQRDDIQKRMLTIIDAAASAAPKARIFVVGHSLGSVLVSHSLLGLREGHAAAGRTVLITLGSPLVSMSRIFPRHVLSPETLVTRYSESAMCTSGLISGVTAISLAGNLHRGALIASLSVR